MSAFLLLVERVQINHSVSLSCTLYCTDLMPLIIEFPKNDENGDGGVSVEQTNADLIRRADMMIDAYQAHNINA